MEREEKEEVRLESDHFDIEVWRGRVYINDDLKFPLEYLGEFVQLLSDLEDKLGELDT